MLRDISLGGTKQLKEKQKKFNQSTWCISQLYLTCLGNYSSGVFKKAIVNVVREKTDHNVIENMVDVILIHRIFDFERFFQLDNKYEKKKTILDALHEGLITMAKNEGWDTDQLLDAYNCCLKKKLEHKWLRGNKYFLSPDKKYFAGVFCNWDIDKFEVMAIFFNKHKEEIERVKLYEREPNDVEPMGKMGWDKLTGEFNLYSKNEKQKWVATPSAGQSG
jgi:hypothetical protein